MQVLYASDLDGTLIYSAKFLAKHDYFSPVYPVEYEDGHPSNYMYAKALDRLAEIRKDPNVVFVPVTLRTAKELANLSLGITPEYAIIANGGAILHNGVPIKEWQNIVHSSLASVDFSYIIQVCRKVFTSHKREPKLIDDCFVSVKLADAKERRNFSNILHDIFPKCSFSSDDARNYILPPYVNKGDSLRWLRRHLKINTTVAAGNQLTDLPMLKVADYAFVTKEAVLEFGDHMRDNSCSLEVMNFVTRLADQSNK